VTEPTRTLDALARPSGALAMVAMDQRESLRTMFDQAGAGRVDDDRMVAFKLDVARALGSLASGFLIDREYGVERAAPLLPSSCGLILAADALEQEAGGPVEETALDDGVLPADGTPDLHGAAAVKLLVIWRRDARREQRVELARQFVARAARRGVLSVLEPVVRATPDEVAAGTWDQEAAVAEAARELSPLGPSLYKVQVPLAGRAEPAALERACAALGEAITGPWVVLSQGVHRDDFAGAVRAACRGGASGFLAGRALWSDVVGRPDVPAALAEVAVPRLQRLVDLVDAEARPWTAA
jgi:sulfofructosephosphate aldolase